MLESATQEVTYFFQFFRLISVGVYDTKALFDFHEIVPDTASVEFVSLAALADPRPRTGNLAVGHRGLRRVARYRSRGPRRRMVQTIPRHDRLRRGRTGENVPGSRTGAAWSNGAVMRGVRRVLVRFAKTGPMSSADLPALANSRPQSSSAPPTRSISPARRRKDAPPSTPATAT